MPDAADRAAARHREAQNPALPGSALRGRAVKLPPAAQRSPAAICRRPSAHRHPAQDGCFTG
ncbi:MAG: hypothetical protein IKM17_06700 [Lentisphaeria bacterium]|nr:hypothetical protein [Lentisphaeria bacterium]MBR4076001.1 hypothetical protein [Lentisphaeria bacterium]